VRVPPLETDEASAPVVTDDMPPDESQPGRDSADSRSRVYLANEHLRF